MIPTISPEKKPTQTHNLFISQMYLLCKHLRACCLPDIILSPGDTKPFKTRGLPLQEV